MCLMHSTKNIKFTIFGICTFGTVSCSEYSRVSFYDGVTFLNIRL